VVARKLSQPAGHLVRRDADSPIEAKLLLILPTHVDKECPLGDEPASLVRVDSQR
jgi:hypothetical protein